MLYSLVGSGWKGWKQKSIKAKKKVKAKKRPVLQQAFRRKGIKPFR